MDLYEYQARELLEEQGIPTPKAVFAQNSHEVAEAADEQIRATQRGLSSGEDWPPRSGWWRQAGEES